MLSTVGSTLCTSHVKATLPSGDVDVQLFSYASTLHGGAAAARDAVPCLTIAAASSAERNAQQQWMLRLHAQLQMMTAAYKLYVDPSKDTLTLDQSCATPENVAVFDQEAGNLKAFLRTNVFETWVRACAI